MGNASAGRKSDLSGSQRSKTTRARAITFVRLSFFLVLFSAAALGQDLTVYAEKLRHGNVEEKREALLQLRNLRSADASRVAVAALSDKTPMVRATAASSVVFLPQAEASAALLPLLKDKDPFVRREGAFALGEVGDPSSGTQLISSLTSDKDLEVKTAAAIALGKIGNPSAVPVLVKLFDQKPTEDNEMLRSAAAKSIGQIAEKMRLGRVTILTPQNFLPAKYKDLGTTPTPDLLSHFSDAVRRLIRLLESSSESDNTRRQAAFSLGAIGDRSSESVLSKYISSPDPYLAEICREALLKLESVE